MMTQLKQITNKTSEVLWAILLLSLPVTSFPWLKAIFGGSSVAPLSVVPLILLTLITIIPTILRTKTIPSEVIPLLLFFAVATIATSMGYFKDIPSFRQTSILNNSIEGFATLITGICFFLIPVYMVKTETDLRIAIKCIYISGCVILIICAMQAFTWLVFKEYPPFLFKIQQFVSSSGRLFIRRVNGLAYEPSWLAHQLNILYIPLFLAASYQGFSLFKFRFFKHISVENILLLFCVGALFMSFSRIGWLTALLIVGFILVRVLNRQIDRRTNQGKSLNWFQRILIWFMLLLLLLGVLAGLGFLLTKIDPRMVKLFDLERYKQFGFLGWASQLGIAERIVFWLSAYQVYLLHPLLGIGLGGAGYFFPYALPNFGYRLPEIVSALTTDTFIPNAKNLWIRLLSETGIIGFICFVLWLYIALSASFQLEKIEKPKVFQWMGLFGKLTLLALVLEGFSIDTFGLPYYWLAFGLVIATSRIQQEQTPSTKMK